MTDIQVESDKWSALATTPALIGDPPFYQICPLSTTMGNTTAVKPRKLEICTPNSLSPAIRRRFATNHAVSLSPNPKNTGDRYMQSRSRVNILHDHTTLRDNSRQSLITSSVRGDHTWTQI